MNKNNPWMKRAVEKYENGLDDSASGDESVITDILADLRHVCDAYGWDFAALDRTAYNHYLQEREGKYDRQAKQWVAADGIAWDGDIL